MGADEADEVRRERFRFVARLEYLLDGPATFLAIVFVLVLAAELVLTAQGEPVPEVLTWIQTGIWIVFIIQFAMGLLISPDRLRYVRRNWITAASLVLPFLRAFRVLRAARALRAVSGVRASTAFNRAAGALADLIAWSRAGYPLALAGTATILGSATIYLFEAADPATPFESYADALWWTLATLTTVGATYEPSTVGGRIAALFVMISGLVILGYVAGVVGALLFDRRVKGGGTRSGGGELGGGLSGPE